MPSTKDSSPSDSRFLDTPTYHASWTSSNAVSIRLKPTATDGDVSKWPTNTEMVINDRGLVNFHDQDEKYNKDWKKKLGRFLAEVVIKPELKRLGRERECTRIDNAEVTLAEFPRGYKLFIHKTGNRHTPRPDPYLFGSTYVHVFRSPIEFGLHLQWLTDGGSLNLTSRKPDCHCKYCDPNAEQGEIHKRFVHLTLGQMHNERKPSTERRKGLLKPRQPSPTKASQIPFKDYTKLNLDPSTSKTAEEGGSGS